MFTPEKKFTAEIINNKSNWTRKVCEMILWGLGNQLTGGVGGDIGYRGRGCVTLLSLESERKEKEKISSEMKVAPRPLIKIGTLMD